MSLNEGSMSAGQAPSGGGGGGDGEKRRGWQRMGPPADPEPPRKKPKRSWGVDQDEEDESIVDSETLLRDLMARNARNPGNNARFGQGAPYTASPSARAHDMYNAMGFGPLGVHNEDMAGGSMNPVGGNMTSRTLSSSRRTQLSNDTRADDMAMDGMDGMDMANTGSTSNAKKKVTKSKVPLTAEQQAAAKEKNNAARRARTAAANISEGIPEGGIAYPMPCLRCLKRCVEYPKAKCYAKSKKALAKCYFCDDSTHHPCIEPDRKYQFEILEIVSKQDAYNDWQDANDVSLTPSGFNIETIRANLTDKKRLPLNANGSTNFPPGTPTEYRHFYTPLVAFLDKKHTDQKEVAKSEETAEMEQEGRIKKRIEDAENQLKKKHNAELLQTISGALGKLVDLAKRTPAGESAKDTRVRAVSTLKELYGTKKVKEALQSQNSVRGDDLADYGLESEEEEEEEEETEEEPEEELKDQFKEEDMDN